MISAVGLCVTSVLGLEDSHAPTFLLRRSKYPISEVSGSNSHTLNVRIGYSDPLD